MRPLRRLMQPLPPDCCPHASGRAGGFGTCPAFRPLVVRPGLAVVPGLDLGTREPSPVLTCVHLAAGMAEDGRFYPSCRLGDRDARRRLARTRTGAWDSVRELRVIRT
jgi:hypothetical protein